jgi:RNA polymerase sigma factor (sigma-70 family)
MVRKEKLLLQLLKKGDKDALKRLYLEYRSAFIYFAWKFSKNSDDILDVYQDTIIVLQEKAIKGELDELKCTLKTYLFGIGKYMLYEKIRKQKKLVSPMKLEQEGYDYHDIAIDFLQDQPNKMQQQLQGAFVTLGKKCKEILTLFYYRGYTINEIRETLNYPNTNVVKSQKSRCLKQLKGKVKTNT